MFFVFIWYFSFLPFVIIPIEISLEAKEKINDEDKLTLIIIWKIYYFINFMNGWIVLPILGYFHFAG